MYCIHGQVGHRYEVPASERLAREAAQVFQLRVKPWIKHAGRCDDQDAG